MRSRLARIAAVADIELRRLLRARTTFTLLLVVPALQVALFGYAIQPVATSIIVGIAADSDVSARRVAEVLHVSPDLEVITTRLPAGTAAAAVKRGAILVGVEVPPLATLTSVFAGPAPLQVFIDDTNPALVSGLVAQLQATYWRAVAERSSPDERLPLSIVRLYNPHQRADWSFVPALIGVVVMISSIMLGSLSLAREREIGTWEALLALPITKAEIMAGKLLPYIVTGTLQGMLVLGIGDWLFDLPMRGSIVALLLLLPVFAAAHVILGYAIATRAATQLEALQGAVAFYLPAMLLSGFLYPFETLPAWARVAGNLFPLTHFIRAARGAALRGDDFAMVVSQGVPIAAFAVVLVVLALATPAPKLD
ncbi:ABC transporter permease [Sphingosinicellaceae bacterium]|nr:ABC transporter permease [Sphingosinicellaceae bacterium]